MTATLDTPEMFRRRELFDPDPYRRPPEMPVFRDEPELPPMPEKKPDKKTDETKTKPLPWWHEQQPYNSLLLEMLYLREQLSMPRPYEGGVSEEKRKKFKREQA